MNLTSQDSVKAVLRCVIVAAAAVCAMHGQTQVNLATQSRDVDFSNAPSTRPAKTGTALPATCLTGYLFFKTNAPEGQNLYGCSAVNTWTLLIGSASASFYQTVETNSTALTPRAALNFSSAFSGTDDSASSLTDIDLATVNSNVGTFGGPSQVPIVTVNAYGLVTGVSTAAISGSGSAAVWGAITGTLSDQMDLETVLSGKQVAGNYLTALTGDGTASGPGSASLTLATVNSASGECGDATHVCQVTTDPKGRVIAQTPVAITGGGSAAAWGAIGGTLSDQTDLQTALSGKQAVGNYLTALTGDVTASGPGSSSATLATVNSGPGQCGDSSHICQVTTNAKGLVTSQTTVAIASGSGNSTSIQGTAVSSAAPTDLQVLQYQAASQSYVPATISGGAGNSAAGTLASAPATCTPGVGVYLYFATDQPAGQQEYQCSATNIWTQFINIGPSGALAMANGSLDIVTSVVPRLPNTNAFTGSNTFSGPVFQIGGTPSDPGCTQNSDIGKIWINTTAVANTALEVCLSVSSAIQWVIK